MCILASNSECLSQLSLCACFMSEITAFILATCITHSCQIILTWLCYSRLQYCPTSLYGEACNVSLCCWTQLTAGVPLNRLTGSHMTGAPGYGSLAVKQLGVNLGQPAEILLWTEYLELETHNKAHRSVLRTIHMRYQLNASALPHPNLWVLKDFIGTNQPIIK